MLNTRRALTKIRSELEEREGKKCWECRQFGHLAKNCRNKGGRKKKKLKTMNRFEVLASRVMQCRVKEVRRQEVVEEELWCFRCGERGHKKWVCPQKKREKVAPPQEVWKKVKEHSGARELPPRGAAMCMERWTTLREVVTFVECRGCNYKGMKTQKNQRQGFLSKEQLCNMWCRECKKAWNWRDREAACERAESVKCGACRGKDTVV